MGIMIRRCSDWNDFKSRIIEELYESGRFQKGKYLFRGQATSSWHLSTTFDRWYHGDRRNKIRVADELLKEFKKECEHEEIIKDIKENDIMMLGLAQHSGLPTRILDWSESPYIAAFFAFSGNILGSNSEKEVAVWVIEENDSIWNEQYGCEIISVSTYNNKRIYNQQGKFTYLKAPYDSLEEYIDNFKDSSESIHAWKYIIPTSETHIAVSDLDAMGINYAKLYPGIEGNAKAAEVRVLMNALFN